MRYQLMTDNELRSLAIAGDGKASQEMFERMTGHNAKLDSYVQLSKDLAVL